MKRYLKYLRVKSIDILVFRMTAPVDVGLPQIGFSIVEGSLPGKKSFSISDGGAFVHNSFLFDKVHVLRLIGKKGPVIGDCVTSPKYRGRSIYPFVINKIAQDVLRGGVSEVF